MNSAKELAEALMEKLDTGTCVSLSETTIKKLMCALNRELLQREQERPVAFPQLENI